MGDISPSPVPLPPAKSAASSHPTPITLQTFDELLLERAADADQIPLIAYPKTKHGVDDYEFFDGAQLNRLVDGAIKALLKEGVEVVYQDTIAAIYGPSDLDYIVTIFALGRLGYTTFILSPRLPVNAIVNLLKGTNATIFLHAPQHVSTASKTALELPLKLIPILTRPQYDVLTTTPPFARANVDPAEETLRKLIMMHSSGSTGLPKPIHYTHQRLLSTFRTSQYLTAFQSVPLFHAHGFISFIQAIHTRKVIHLFNGHVPQTHQTLVKAIRAADPEIVWTVPYVLKLLAEKRDGIEVLKKCKVVSCSGSRCPDELGDLLVNEGIHFGSAFGATEVALILTSLNRPRDDKAWNYLRPPPHVVPYILMQPVDGEVCECVVLEGHRGKVATNSNDPPNSWHTKDLFVAHPTIKNAWKFVGRMDDRVTLTNGEKVLPLPIEGRIQLDPLVREAAVFGVDRPVPGLLLFRAKAAEGLSNVEFVGRVWPAIEDANSRAEAFSQISREMIAVIGEDVECPSTDKSSIKRAAVYREFKDVIDGVYATLERSCEGSLKLNVGELEGWIAKSFAELGIQLDSVDADFFSAGVDSLKAIQMRGLIVKSLDLGGNAAKCGSMIVYDCGNAARLAKVLFAIRVGDEGESGALDQVAVMRALIDQYSKFETRSKTHSKNPETQVVMLTGATGSLGSHLLAQLVALPSVTKIYCPLRTTSLSQSASSRLEEALKIHNVAGMTTSDKIVPLSSDLSRTDFGMVSPVLEELKTEVTHIIHCAWEVNFALPVQSFTPQLASLQNLINFSLCSPFASPPRVLFCSSIGTAMETPSRESRVVIPEKPIDDLNHASPTGYARSKLIAERVIEKAVGSAEANATILRIGQIMPAKNSGSQLWNPNEMIPLMVRSALTTKSLPDNPGGSGQCSWIDVDTLSKAIVEIGRFGELDTGARSTQLVYNLVHPRPFSWEKDFIPSLKTAGLEFETTDWQSWLEKLKRSEEDAVKNPSRKLLEFWDEGSRCDGKKEVVFETRAAEAKSVSLRSAESVLSGDYVAQLLAAWRAAW